MREKETRATRSGMPVDDVKEMIRKDSGAHFATCMLEAFLVLEDLSV